MTKLVDVAIFCAHWKDSICDVSVMDRLWILMGMFSKRSNLKIQQIGKKWYSLEIQSESSNKCEWWFSHTKEAEQLVKNEWIFQICLDHVYVFFFIRLCCVDFDEHMLPIVFTFDVISFGRLEWGLSVTNTFQVCFFFICSVYCAFVPLSALALTSYSLDMVRQLT